MLFSFYNLESNLIISKAGWSAKNEGLWDIQTPSLQLACKTDTIEEAVGWIELIQNHNEIRFTTEELDALDDYLDPECKEVRVADYKERLSALAPGSTIGNADEDIWFADDDTHDPAALALERIQSQITESGEEPFPEHVTLGKRQLSDKGKELLQFGFHSSDGGSGGDLALRSQEPHTL